FSALRDDEIDAERREAPGFGDTRGTAADLDAHRFEFADALSRDLAQVKREYGRSYRFDGVELRALIGRERRLHRLWALQSELFEIRSDCIDCWRLCGILDRARVLRHEEVHAKR